MNELAMAVVTARCEKCHQLFGISYRQVKEGEWLAYWTFPLSESTNQREGYSNTQLAGTCKFDSHYPGCPYCHSFGLASCGACHKITCWDPASPDSHCAWCGNTWKVTETSDFHDLHGSGDI